MINRNNKHNKRKVKEDRKINTREDKKKKKNTVHDLREGPKTGKKWLGTRGSQDRENFFANFIVNFVLNFCENIDRCCMNVLNFVQIFLTILPCPPRIRCTRYIPGRPDPPRRGWSKSLRRPTHAALPPSGVVTAMHCSRLGAITHQMQAVP